MWRPAIEYKKKGFYSIGLIVKKKYKVTDLFLSADIVCRVCRVSADRHVCNLSLKSVCRHVCRRSADMSGNTLLLGSSFNFVHVRSSNNSFFVLLLVLFVILYTCV